MVLVLGGGPEFYKIASLFMRVVGSVSLNPGVIFWVTKIGSL